MQRGRRTELAWTVDPWRRARRSRGVAAVGTVVALALSGCTGGDGTAVVAPSSSPSASDTASASATDRPDDGTPSVGTSETELPGEQDSAWQPVAAPPVGPEFSTIAGAWGGGEFLVLGSEAQGFGSAEVADLWGFDPTTSSWQQHASLESAVVPWSAELVWTGRQLLVLSPPGEDATTMALHVWDADGDQWWQASSAPLERTAGHSITWTGTHLVVFGGLVTIEADGISSRNETLATGAAWDLEQDSWFTLGAFPHDSRSSHGAVWNGRRLVVFGGGHASGRFEAEGEWSWDRSARGAAAWDPASNTWTSIADPGVDGPLVASTWTGDRIVWWDGGVVGSGRGVGGVWDTNTGTVEPLAPPPLPMRRDAAPAVWAPELESWITWGGMCGEGCNQNADTGAVWHAVSNTWSLLPPNDLGRRLAPTAWTGEELLVIGGHIADQASGTFEAAMDGARWHP